MHTFCTCVGCLKCQNQQFDCKVFVLYLKHVKFGEHTAHLLANNPYKVQTFALNFTHV